MTYHQNAKTTLQPTMGDCSNERSYSFPTMNSFLTSLKNPKNTASTKLTSFKTYLNNHSKSLSTAHKKGGITRRLQPTNYSSDILMHPIQWGAGLATDLLIYFSPQSTKKCALKKMANFAMTEELSKFVFMFVYFHT